MLASTRVSLARGSIVVGNFAALDLIVFRFLGVRLGAEVFAEAGFDLVVELDSIVQGFFSTHG